VLIFALCITSCHVFDILYHIGSRTPSDTRDGFPFIKSSPTRLSSQSSQEDCMPFPLDLSTGQDESHVPENNSPLRSDGFSINKKSDKTSGQSPSKHPSLLSRYIMGNNHVPSTQRLDHTGKRTKESKIGEGNDPKGGYREGTEVCCGYHTLPYRHYE
jgi:serine/threonine-protein kinase ULK/ATG1